MSDMCKIQSTPWHVGRYTRQEGDERRHKSNCVYYRKKDKFCTKHHGECYGSAHCDYYESNKQAAEESLLETVTKVRNDEFVRKCNQNKQAEQIRFVEGMKVYRKRDGAFGTVTKVYWHENGSRYVIMSFNGKNVEFSYDAAASSGNFIKVTNRK